jgi:mono/diheme cytochrome c family protein
LTDSHDHGAAEKKTGYAWIDLPTSGLLLSTTTMLRLVALASLLAATLVAQPAATQGSGKASPPKEAPTGGAAKGPLPYTASSIARGKQFYLRHCVDCHDQDGRGLGRRDFNGTPPADLTDPDAWLHGTSAEAIFSSIHDGAKEDMPGFKDKLQDEQIWHVVNFVRSLWPEAKRPKVETATESK